jgi:hypothetical protein
MKIQRFAIAVTLINLALLTFLIAQNRKVEAQTVTPMLRGRGLETVDGQGRITVEPPVTMDSQTPPEFVGTTPCDNLPRQLLGIPANSPCERITWQLTLLTNQNSRLPTTWKLVSTYGMQAHNAPGFVGGGTTVELQGTWAIVKGTKSNPDAVVYDLNADKPQKSLSFVKVGEHLLHLLNRDKGLLIGNASWSYTLNKKGMDN